MCLIYLYISRVNPCYALLSNFEVMEALRGIGDTKKKFGLRNLATISYEVLFKSKFKQHFMLYPFYRQFDI